MRLSFLRSGCKTAPRCFLRFALLLAVDGVAVVSYNIGNRTFVLPHLRSESSVYQVRPRDGGGDALIRTVYYFLSRMVQKMWK